MVCSDDPADTYCEFVDANESVLKSLPPPAVAVNYYKNGDLYLVREAGAFVL